VGRQHASVTLQPVTLLILGVGALWPRRTERVTFGDRSDIDLECNARPRPIPSGIGGTNVLTLEAYLVTIAMPLMFLSALIPEMRRTGRKLIDAREQERRRIGRELHDDVVQQLVLIGLEVKDLRPIRHGRYVLINYTIGFPAFLKLPATYHMTCTLLRCGTWALRGPCAVCVDRLAELLPSL